MPQILKPDFIGNKIEQSDHFWFDRFIDNQIDHFEGKVSTLHSIFIEILLYFVDGSPVISDRKQVEKKFSPPRPFPVKNLQQEIIIAFPDTNSCRQVPRHQRHSI